LVEGVPLAIELAINLTTTRSFDEIADLIANDPDRLETRSQDVPQRQRSLRAVFDYSWDLLDEGEQQALRSVSVFPTSFTTKAAIEITGITEQYLRALVEKSFLRRGENGRFEMHVLLRQFANEKLYETTTEQTIQHLKEQHSIYYLTFVQNHEANLHSPEGSYAIQKIRQEIDNIRFAWHWIVTQVDISAMAQNSPSLVSYFAISGQCREGERLFDLAIKSLDAATLAKRDKGVEKELHRLTSYLLTRRVRLLVKLGEVTEAMAAIKLAVKHGQLAEDIDTQLEARLYWGTLFWRQGNYNGALEQSAIAQKLREHATAEVTKIRVIVQQCFLHYCQSNFTESRRCYEQALHYYKAIGYEG
jgi:tetratricopeptide (TPR) repeat protein